MTFERHISCKFSTFSTHDDVKYERCRHVFISHTARSCEIMLGQRMNYENTPATAHLSKAESMAYTGHDSHSSCIVDHDRNNSQRRGARKSTWNNHTLSNPPTPLPPPTKPAPRRANTYLDPLQLPSHLHPTSSPHNPLSLLPPTCQSNTPRPRPRKPPRPRPSQA
jgi:hypothetical protein